MSVLEELRLKLSDIDRIQLIGGHKGSRKKALTVFNELEEKPDYLINAGMYDSNTGMTSCDTIVNGVLINGGNYINKGFAWNTSGMYPKRTEDANGIFQYFLGGSPSIIWKGNIEIEPKGFTTKFLSITSAIRIGMGINDKDELIFCFPKKSMTVKKFARVMKNVGCTHAINLDGGGSTSILKKSGNGLEALNKRTEDRANSTWLAIYMKKSTKEISTSGGNDTMAKKVFIGVGHGYNPITGIGDPGAVSGKFKEADINLPIALACRDELVRHGVEVRMSRDKQEVDPLEDEISECNAYNPSLAVDIHINAGGGDGFEVYHYSKGGTSKILAGNIESEVIKVGQNSRGLKTKLNSAGKDYYGFIRNIVAPSVIVECAFIDNTKDLAIVDTLAEQKIYGMAIAKGILKTLGIKYKEDLPKEEPKVWYASAQEFCMTNGISDGTRPNDTLTRAEAWSMLERFYKLIK